MKNVQAADLVPTAVLLNIAKRIRSAAKSIADSKNVPIRSANEIGIPAPRITKNTAEIQLTLSPKLMAFERGSGTKKKKGGAKYPIVPRSASALAFEGTNAFEGQYIVTKLVMHPGVSARPFLAPAKRQTRKQNLEDIRKTNLANTRLIIKSMKRVV